MGADMRKQGVWAGMAMALAAGTAAAQDPGYTVVPPADRLTVGGVFADAAPEVQVVFALLLLATLGAVVVWAMGLRKVGLADAKALAAALGRLKIVRSAGAPLGLLAASYT